VVAAVAAVAVAALAGLPLVTSGLLIQEVAVLMLMVVVATELPEVYG
jgi:hypothetical protein